MGVLGLLGKAIHGRNLLSQAKRLAEEHHDQIAKGLDKAAQVADDKTKGKYSDKIGSGVKAVKKLLPEKPPNRPEEGDPPAAPPISP